MEIHFKKGVYYLNEQSNFDFQLNRVVMWDGGDLEEIKAVGPKIKTSEDWKRELIALGDKASSEGRIENAIAYYRMSEFFMYDGDPDKKAYYVKATEKRIRRVIAWSIFPNFRDVILSASSPNEEKRMKLAKWLLDHHCKTVINAVFNRLAKNDEMIRWGLEHGKYAYEAKDAYEYAQKMNKFQMLDIAEKITQDILIVGANKDHFIPYAMIGGEINALKNARSLTFRLFTDKKDACNRCNCGNVKLTFDTFMNWIEQIKRSDFY